MISRFGRRPSNSVCASTIRPSKAQSGGRGHDLPLPPRDLADGRTPGDSTGPEGQEREYMTLKRRLIVLAMMVAIGVFFAGLTSARADSGDDGDDPTPTCTLP